MILGGRGVEADRAELNVNGSDVVFNANGSIGAFQIKIKHIFQDMLLGETITRQFAKD